MMRRQQAEAERLRAVLIGSVASGVSANRSKTCGPPSSAINCPTWLHHLRKLFRWTKVRCTNEGTVDQSTSPDEI